MKLLPVTDSVKDYCDEVAAKANKMGLRVEVDRGNERLAKQIRNAEQGMVGLSKKAPHSNTLVCSLVIPKTNSLGVAL